eukprot:6490681-Amphidinium_carterae.1
MTIGMIGLHQPTDNEAQPVVAVTPTTLATSRAMRQPQAQQLRRRRSTYTPPRNVQQQRDIVARDNAVELAFAQRQMTITLPWSFFASLLMTIIVTIYYCAFTTATLTRQSVPSYS